jgi:hypothetical protein
VEERLGLRRASCERRRLFSSIMVRDPDLIEIAVVLKGIKNQILFKRMHLVKILNARRTTFLCCLKLYLEFKNSS